jgi:hypothetical protein
MPRHGRAGDVGDCRYETQAMAGGPARGRRGGRPRCTSPASTQPWLCAASRCRFRRRPASYALRHRDPERRRARERPPRSGGVQLRRPGGRHPRRREAAAACDYGGSPYGTGLPAVAFSTSARAEVRRPLATAVIGGLIAATPLTLVLLPAVDTTVADLHRPSSGPGPLPATVPKRGGARRLTRERDKVSAIGMWIRNSVLMPGRCSGDYAELTRSGSPACWTATPLPTRSRRS